MYFLVQNLQDLLDKSKHGVIYFNLGSTISEDLSKEMKQELLRAFRQVEQTVVWNYPGKLEYVPGNVHLLNVAPRLAVLSKFVVLPNKLAGQGQISQT